MDKVIKTLGKILTILVYVIIVCVIGTVVIGLLRWLIKTIRGD